MRTLAIILLLFLPQINRQLDLKKAYESNNDEYQGILKGKVKSIQLFLIYNGVDSKGSYFTKFDTAGNVRVHVMSSGAKFIYSYKNGKLVKEETFDKDNSSKPIDVTNYNYSNGLLKEEINVSGKSINKYLYFYENGENSKIVHYLNDKEYKIDNFKYTKDSKEATYLDSTGKQIGSWSLKYFPSENKVINVINTPTLNKNSYFIFDKNGNEIEYKDNNNNRKSKYLKYDASGNWTNKIMYWNKDTIVANRIIEYY